MVVVVIPIAVIPIAVIAIAVRVTEGISLSLRSSLLSVSQVAHHIEAAEMVNTAVPAVAMVVHPTTHHIKQ